MRTKRASAALRQLIEDREQIQADTRAGHRDKSFLIASGSLILTNRRLLFLGDGPGGRTQVQVPWTAVRAVDQLVQGWFNVTYTRVATVEDLHDFRGLDDKTVALINSLIERSDHE